MGQLTALIPSFVLHMHKHAVISIYARMNPSHITSQLSQIKAGSCTKIYCSQILSKTQHKIDAYCFSVLKIILGSLFTAKAGKVSS